MCVHVCMCVCVHMRECVCAYESVCVCRGRDTFSDISECDEMSQAFPTMLAYSNIVGRLALLSLNTKLISLVSHFIGLGSS